MIAEHWKVSGGTGSGRFHGRVRTQGTEQSDMNREDYYDRARPILFRGAQIPV